MAQPHVIEVIKGEQLYDTFTIEDTSLDMSTATLTIKAEDALFLLNMSATDGADTDEVTVSAAAANTTFAPTGTYDAEVWATWASGSPSKKRVLRMLIVIKDAADE